MRKNLHYLKGLLIVLGCGFLAFWLFKSPVFYVTLKSEVPRIFERGKSAFRIRSLKRVGGRNDVSAFNLSDAMIPRTKTPLLNLSFDTLTVWPEGLPDGFSPSKVIEIGKNPGLGIKKIHEKGITGKGVSLAVIDQRIFTGHREYAENLKSYEEIHYFRFEKLLKRKGHGEAILSVLAGKTCGVAPGSHVYYIAVDPGTLTVFSPDYYSYDFKWLARAVRRTLEIDRKLPAGRKIKAIVFTFLWPDSSLPGYGELMDALDEASSRNIFIASPLSDYYGYRIAGLTRSPLDDPDDFGSYEPSPLFEEFLKNDKAKVIFVPGDSRTVASPYGAKEYAFVRRSKYSVSVSYLAGLWALAIGVKRDLKPADFMAKTYDSAKKIKYGRSEIRIINPVKLINEIREEKNENIQRKANRQVRGRSRLGAYDGPQRIQEVRRRYAQERYRGS